MKEERERNRERDKIVKWGNDYERAERRKMSLRAPVSQFLCVKMSGIQNFTTSNAHTDGTKMHKPTKQKNRKKIDTSNIFQA